MVYGLVWAAKPHGTPYKKGDLDPRRDDLQFRAQLIRGADFRNLLFKAYPHGEALGGARRPPPFGQLAGNGLPNLAGSPDLPKLRQQSAASPIFLGMAGC